MNYILKNDNIVQQKKQIIQQTEYVTRLSQFPLLYLLR